MSIISTLSPPRRILMGPGPSDVPPQVLEAMSRPTIGHLDPVYLQAMVETQQMLRRLFRTENQLTMAISGTGSAGMETCVVNLIEPDDVMLVCVNGVFGRRMVDVATRAGAKVTAIERPWGEVFTPEEIAEAMERVRPKVVGIVMAETSTGAAQPIADVARVVRDAGALLLVDAVTSLGGMPVEVDAWQIDAIYSGTQKCLSCPPGLSPVSFSSRAAEVIQKRRTKVASWYLDVSMLASYWGEDRVYHHTAPINMTYALHEAVRLILSEGLNKVFSRHQRHHQALAAGLAAIGVEYAAAEGNRLPMLNAVKIPADIDDLRVRNGLLERHGIEIGGGLGDFKGKAWRIGLMGHACRANNVLLLLAALETTARRTTGRNVVRQRSCRRLSRFDRTNCQNCLAS